MWPSDHKWCFEKARNVLKNDKRDRIDLVDRYAEEIKEGLEIADTGAGMIQTQFGSVPIVPVLHYLNPFKNTGIGGWISIGAGVVTNAALLCESCHDIARQLWQQDADNALPMKIFGIALHLVQDLTVPHHARCQPLFNHREYEEWLHNNIEETPIPSSNGNYNHSKYPVEWVYSNAREAYGFFGYCDGFDRNFWNPLTWFTKNEDLVKVRDAMVPLAVLSSAGFIDYFLHKLHS